MSATARQVDYLNDAAELLRIAETGDVDELLRVLPRISDINVRNRHGMTALMKAAFFGHEAAVRVLLQHGADPNSMRNDRFTALALAAFFGHGETVKTLIEYGAKTEAITRAGASARTWARVRTFDEVARCLESYAPKPVKITPTPVTIDPPTPVAVTSSTVVKTLKEPPEIWDLVHEVPRGFNPRSAFVARITSMKWTLALGACAALLLIVACGVGAWMLRSSKVRSLPPANAPAQVAVETTPVVPVPAQTVVESAPVEVVNDNHTRAVPNTARILIRQPRTASIVSDAPVVSVETKEAPAVATPQFESPKPAAPAVKTTSNAALSPNLITPAKNAPPKGKVIQWP